MTNLLQILNNSVKTYPENIAFNIDGKSYSYFQLTQNVARIQYSLLQNNTGLKSVGIIANQDFETYSTIIAALLSGITYIPIEPTHPDERNNHIIRLSKVKSIFCSDFSSLSEEFHEANKHIFIQVEKGEKGIREFNAIQTENPAYVLFTSGSTGVPKGVPISMQNLKAFVENVDRMNLGINEQSRFLQVFELTFDLSVFSYLVPLFYGASVYILPKTPFKQMAAIQLIEEQSITHVLSVPSFVGYLKPFFQKIKLPSILQWLFCGEALKSDLVTEWQKCVPNTSIYNVYGPTEATIFCTAYKCLINNFKEYHGIVCIGKPFNDIVFALFDGNLPISDIETNAELCISGSQLTTGYLDDPRKNETAFFSFKKQVFYRSGDLCRIDNEGDYFFSGRNDTQVKINGYRVEISELEFHAASFPGIDEAVVIVTSNEKNNQQVLNLVFTSKTELNKDEIVDFLTKKIPGYMLPGNIYPVKSIPYNLNGKIDKRALAEQIATIN
jgi:D-alanine--poly(phosphoribitol) ligase subunit 1